MTLEQCFTSTEHGCLFYEFIEWLVETPNRKLARQTWLMATIQWGPGKDNTVAHEIGAIFTASEDGNLEDMFQMLVDTMWQDVIDCPAKTEIDSM